MSSDHKEERHFHIPSESSQDPGYEMTTSTLIKQSKEDDIKSAKGKLDGLIEQLNGKLIDHFQRKEQDLLEEYKQELMGAQRELNQLRANTNEEQIRNKMIQRKKELEKERHQLIEANMFFSNKCEVYKKKLGSLIQEGKELEREVVFLEGQLHGANRKRLMLMSEVEDSKLSNADRSSAKDETGDIPMFSAHKAVTRKLENETPQGKTQAFTDKKLQESTKAKASSLKKISKSMSIQNPSMMKNKKTLNYMHSELPSVNGVQGSSSKIFQKTPIQQLFEQAVEKVREKRKGKRTMPLIKGEEFTDYEKRLIMEEFLSKQKVKKKIYQIIFDQSQQPGKQTGNPKVRISFDDVGL